MKTVEWGESYPSGNTEHRMQYGICLHLSDGTVLKVDDIASSPTDLQHFIRRLQGEQIDSTQLYYLIEDHLAREYLL